jgi:hypothetical protein
MLTSSPTLLFEEVMLNDAMVLLAVARLGYLPPSIMKFPPSLYISKPVPSLVELFWNTVLFAMCIAVLQLMAKYLLVILNERFPVTGIPTTGIPSIDE